MSKRSRSSGKKVESNEVLVEPIQKIKAMIRSVTPFSTQPVLNVLAIVVFILGIFAAVKIVRERPGVTQLRFLDEDTSDQIPLERTDSLENYPEDIFAGEAYQTSVRLRETGALGMAISLTAAAEISEKRSTPSDLRSVLAAVLRLNMMPPDLVADKDLVMSPSSTLTIRYQPDPLQFEILSRPKPNTKGPALLLRFPLVVLNGQTVCYFQSNSSRTIDSPAAFSSMDQMIAAGWTIEVWRGDVFPLDQALLNSLEEERVDLKNSADLKR